MKLGVVHKERLTREVLTPDTAPFKDAAARQALIKGLSEIALDPQSSQLFTFITALSD